MHIMELLFGTFALVGAVDRVTGNHLKLGEEFEKGIMSIAPLVFAMVGMIVIAPTLSSVLIRVFTPLSELLHIDLSVIGSFIANDMGGAIIAYELSPGTTWAGFNGLIVASMFGSTVCLIPMALKMIDSKYHEDVLNGLLCGIATIPLGCIVAGLMLGCPFLEMLRNLVPVILLSVLSCIGLVLNPKLCRKIFAGIGYVLLVVIGIGLGIGMFEHITGIGLLPETDPVINGFETVCNIAIILAGVYPLLAVLSRLFARVFSRLGRLIRIDDTSVLGMITALVNSVPMFGLMDKMNKKGRIMNMALAAAGSCVFGDHLAFTMAYDARYLSSMIVGKLIGGISAAIVAHFLYEHVIKKEESAAETN